MITAEHCQLSKKISRKQKSQLPTHPAKPILSGTVNWELQLAISQPCGTFHYVLEIVMLSPGGSLCSRLKHA